MKSTQKSRQLILGNTLIYLIISIAPVVAQYEAYHQYFTEDYLKIDLNHNGNHDTEYYFVEQYHKYTPWAGAKSKLIDKTGFGDNYLQVFDSTTQTLIYSKGYNNLFYEWQDTKESETEQRSFEEVIKIPFPKKTVEIKISRRLTNNNLKPLLRFFLNPQSYRITQGLNYHFRTERLRGQKSSNKAVDIALIAEGYTKEEMTKFRKDCQQMINFMFTTPPFTQLKNQFNIWLIYSISEESGTDIFGENTWKSTILNTHFHTFGSERYLTSQSLKKIYDIAALVPHDQVYILVNSAKYGGGGIFNYYNLTSVDHALSPWVFIHEFGHGFVGLADEYYNGTTAFDGMYKTKSEPWALNISTLAQPQKKWLKRVEKETPIPTPATNKYKNKIGFYEGGGYVSKGVYRPYQDCEMKTLKAGFCPICSQAIIDMIELTTDN